MKNKNNETATKNIRGTYAIYPSKSKKICHICNKEFFTFALKEDCCAHCVDSVNNYGGKL